MGKPDLIDTWEENRSLVFRVDDVNLPASLLRIVQWQKIPNGGNCFPVFVGSTEWRTSTKSCAARSSQPERIAVCFDDAVENISDSGVSGREAYVWNCEDIIRRVAVPAIVATGVFLWVKLHVDDQSQFVIGVKHVSILEFKTPNAQVQDVARMAS